MIMFFSSLAKPKLIYTIMAIVFFSWPKVYKIALFKIMDYMGKNKVKYTLLIKGNWYDVLKKLLPNILPVMSTFSYYSAIKLLCMRHHCLSLV